MTAPDQNARSESVREPVKGLLKDDGFGCELPMDHPLVKALHKAVREKQEARERLERQHYVDPRDIRFVMGGR